MLNSSSNYGSNGAASTGAEKAGWDSPVVPWLFPAVVWNRI